MKENDFHLTIPAKVGEQLHLTAETPVRLVVKNNQLVVQFTDLPLRIFQLSVWIWPVVTAFIASLGFYLANRPTAQISLTGSQSLASWFILVGVLVGMLLFAGFFIRNRRRVNHTYKASVYWRTFPVITLAVTVILLLGLLGWFWLLGSAFAGASFDRFTASLIFFIFGLFVNIVMVYAALAIDAGVLSTLLTLVIVCGVVISMATNGQHHWWQHNLSFLGTAAATNAWQFNLTLIFSALLMFALIDYLFVALQAQFPGSKRLLVLRLILSATALDFGAVGAIPNNAAGHVWHDRVSWLLVWFIISLIAGVRWLLPRVTRDFLWLSYGVAATLVIIAMGFKVWGYLSLAAFEMLDFLLAFGWLLLLLDRIQDLIATGTESVITRVAK
ncbi:LPXTG cell wall anchor domain-containing protein [Lacticaseibacillus nasuensis]|uniref:LPXTG cell wall anchor domain-containing protein n=1 Tax=Lacticaseibacillus nasuensis TaxID=944671 RepID=UPI002245B7BA|nr:LPXTG cell wall anchor domain-containing protein [Lacticaseibacillus nasuensis]MCX2456411.1 LPXTG cell wall anchor domain-containing protein [Lacticaseibacillus nasuensis]